jgi:hypothetical protein
MRSVLGNHTLGPVPNRRSTSDDRREIRLALASAPAFLCVGANMRVDVHILDLSRNGLGIATDFPLDALQTVLVFCGGLTINGTVLHCRESATKKYATGIRINRIINERTGKEM